MWNTVISAALSVLLLVQLSRAACPKTVSRAEWKAVSPVSVKNISNPVPYVVIHHTYQPPACKTRRKCAADMRSMQNFHMNTKQWEDIGYNFLIGGNGEVYEGRGWGVVGTHAPNYNSRSIGISFIGDYRTELPTAEMLSLAKSMIQCGVERGSIASDYKLIGHSQVRRTECPGQALLNEIKKWPHWEPIKL
ncbi:Peptidoglycan-recognition protein LB [Blattella germanica]|nr:Peptidoglycan-recognition protein LB [Blattella germanica]PSN41492.1 Peptidoglycan-recognition protein LB [Blattella germanica]